MRNRTKWFCLFGKILGKFFGRSHCKNWYYFVEDGHDSIRIDSDLTRIRNLSVIHNYQAFEKCEFSLLAPMRNRPKWLCLFGNLSKSFCLFDFVFLEDLIAKIGITLAKIEMTLRVYVRLLLILHQSKFL